MANRKQSGEVESAELTAFRRAVAGRGWLTWEPLARLLKVKPATISSAVTKRFVGFDLLRWRIEAEGFSYDTAIWSTGETLRLRKRFKDELGVDPYLVGGPKLRELARHLRLNLPLARQTTPTLCDALIAHAAVTPKLSTSQL